jgi:hypothetical protein
MIRQAAFGLLYTGRNFSQVGSLDKSKALMVTGHIRAFSSGNLAYPLAFDAPA